MAKKSSNQELLSVIQGISQVMANKHDGALDDDGKGEPIEIGLNREVNNILTDSRTIDGFSARVQSDFLIITYQSELLMRDIYEKKFKNEIEDIFSNIVKFLKKQYKFYTNQTLSLKDKGDAKIRVETVSRVRSWVIAQKIFQISNVDIEGGGEDKKLEKAIENWLSLKSNKKPKNVKISKTDNDKKE